MNLVYFDSALFKKEKKNNSSNGCFDRTGKCIIFSGIIINLAEHWNLQSYIYKGKKGDLYSGCSLRTARRWFLSLK